MKNNKLTLKQLQLELEALKTKKNSNSNNQSKSELSHDIKNSYINNLFQKSSLFYLWILTAILGYANKIPFIKHIISALGLWYGRTTWWKILIKLRKIFIIFNALIGMIMVYKSVGFGMDNVLAGIAGMGHTYYEIFINMNRRLFNWIFDLLDLKIVPKVPKNPGGGGFWQGPQINPWDTRHLLDQINASKEVMKASDWLKSPFQININPSNPWYTDSWKWILGFIVIGGAAYFGYKMVTDPLFISGDNAPLPGNNPPPGVPPAGGVASTLFNAANAISRGLIGVYSTTTGYLNPFRWVGGAHPCRWCI